MEEKKVKVLKVKAIAPCYIGNKRRRVGEVFQIPVDLFSPVSMRILKGTLPQENIEKLEKKGHHDVKATAYFKTEAQAEAEDDAQYADEDPRPIGEDGKHHGPEPKNFRAEQVQSANLKAKEAVKSGDPLALEGIAHPAELGQLVKRDEKKAQEPAKPQPESAKTPAKGEEKKPGTGDASVI